MNIEETTVATDVPAEAVETPSEIPVEAPKEETVGEALAVPETPTPKEDTVSLSKYMKEKKARQELEAQLQALQEQPNRTASQVSADLKDLADEHNVDITFLERLTATLEARSEARAEAKLKPILEKEKQAQIDAKFTAAFDRAMESMPEYDGIVNKSVIKTLSLDPSNANKTFAQIIEEAYGSVVGGKRTIEQRTVPRGGNTSGALDYERAKSDNNYFKEVMADPVLKKQYNDRLFQES
jgi:hypothetical protein